MNHRSAALAARDGRLQSTARSRLTKGTTMNRTIKLGGAAVLVAVALLASTTGSALGAGNGTVSAQVTVASGACLTLGTNAVNYGTQPFSMPSSPSSQQTGLFALASCSSSTEQISAEGTNATGNAGASWTLKQSTADLCTLNLDQYESNAKDPGVGAVPLGSLSYANLGSPYSAGEVRQVSVGMTMPCTGSSGAGQTMSFQYLFLAS